MEGKEIVKDQFKYLKNLKEISKLVHNIDGSFIEFGVYKGTSLRVLLEESDKYKKWIYAVDSFEGMSEPTNKDLTNGIPDHPTGQFNDTSIELIEKIKKEYNSNYKPCRLLIYKGFVPKVLEEIPKKINFSLAHLDLYHYDTTLSVLNWLTDKMAVGGIVICHDYFPNQLNTYASGAIHKFIDEKQIQNSVYLQDGTKIYWKVE
jgi:hypothetical protein